MWISLNSVHEKYEIPALKRKEIYINYYTTRNWMKNVSLKLELS
jgi:hypothetical protein